MEYILSVTKPEKDYELIDSGDSEKLERYGSVVIARPDPQALWPKQRTEKWRGADASFSRDGKAAGWTFHKKTPERWLIEFSGLKFFIKPSAFKHTGLFPEHAPNWEWMRALIKDQGARSQEQTVRVLNLFGYTGGASLACAQAGAEVVHVDGSKVAITWARENAEASGLKDKPIRWILDDATAFVKREIKRGHTYEGIVLDPPAFGHGPKGEMWKIEEHFLPFLEMCRQLLSDKPLFFLVNGYAAGYSALSYRNNLESVQQKYGGEIEMGELTIQESNVTERLLSCGIFARWKK